MNMSGGGHTLADVTCDITVECTDERGIRHEIATVLGYRAARPVAPSAPPAPARPVDDVDIDAVAGETAACWKAMNAAMQASDTRAMAVDVWAK